MHLSSGRWKYNSHILPYALLSGRKKHLAWCALKVFAQRYFASLLPFPLARISNYQHGCHLEATRNDQAGRQTDCLSFHCSLYSGELLHWTEIQEPFHLRQLHRQEEPLGKAKFLKVTLQTAAVPAVLAPIKTELSYRRNTIIAFFFAANRNNDNA